MGPGACCFRSASTGRQDEMSSRSPPEGSAEGSGAWVEACHVLGCMNPLKLAHLSALLTKDVPHHAWFLWSSETLRQDPAPRKYPKGRVAGLRDVLELGP